MNMMISYQELVRTFPISIEAKELLISITSEELLSCVFDSVTSAEFIFPENDNPVPLSVVAMTFVKVNVPPLWILAMLALSPSVDIRLFSNVILPCLIAIA